MNTILLIGAVLGFISVSFGAYSEHGLQPKISSETFRFVMTAVRYNQVYSVIVTAIGLVLFANLPEDLMTALFWAGIIFTIGVVLFSFSIYLSAQFGIPQLTKLTPLGGITLMIGWIYLIWIAITLG